MGDMMIRQKSIFLYFLFIPAFHCLSQETRIDLTALSLEELVNIEVTTVSKKEEELFHAAAAIFVITGDDIRQSGATSLPEALSMVPGMEVARFDANKWGVTSRGFNDLFANKLLVLIDGRSVYSPIFSGVFWDMQNISLADVLRIEVIRGPGATLWGANAVNGIINIITKHTSDTQGGEVTFGLGTNERAIGNARFGGRINEDVSYRIFTNYMDRDSFVYSDGSDGADEWDVFNAGFRLDFDNKNDSFVVQADGFKGHVGQAYLINDLLEPPYQRRFDYQVAVSGVNILGRWNHVFSDHSDMMLQFYYDYVSREEAVLKGILNIYDLDFHHRFELGQYQEVVWGMGYRFISDAFDSTFAISFNPQKRDFSLKSAFVQDEITLVHNRLRLIAGAKFEHNDYTGLEIQPNVRFVSMPNERMTVWAAVSRAVRTPSRADMDVRLNQRVYPPDSLSPGFPTTLITLFGNRNFVSEEIMAYELGFRVNPIDKFFLDLSLFYNSYSNFYTIELDMPYLNELPVPHLVIPVHTDNKMDAETYGFELSADLQILPQWRLRMAYSFLHINMFLHEDSWYTAGETWEGYSPDHQVFLRSYSRLSKNIEWNIDIRYVSSLPDINIESIVHFNTRFGLTLSERLHFFLVGQNLLYSQRPQFKGSHVPTIPTEVQRGFYTGFTWKF